MPATYPEHTCFVISPIGEAGTEARQRADRVFEHVIEPAALENGLTAIRADQISAPGTITSQVISHLQADRLVVADLTDRNANVFYELALRHAFKRPTVQMIEVGQSIPFDVHSARTIRYSGGEWKQARELVSAQIGTALGVGFSVENPVTMAVQLQALSVPPAIELQAAIRQMLDSFDGIRNAMSGIRLLLAARGNSQIFMPRHVTSEMF